MALTVLGGVIPGALPVGSRCLELSFSFAQRCQGTVRHDVPEKDRVGCPAGFIFYMMDVDSHDNYLFTQKLWLATGSSLQGDVARTNLIFFPQFDAMPYGL